MRLGNLIAGAVVLVLVALSLTVGPTRAFITTYQATGSETLAGIANGFLRAVSWPVVLAGHQPDSLDDGPFMACLRDHHLDPAAVAAPYLADAPAAFECARPYAQSHIDMSGATQAQFSSHIMPDPSHPGSVIVSLMNKSSDKILLGADLLFRSNGHVELRHVTAVAFPGHPAQAETPVSLMADGNEPPDFGFSAIPNIARITSTAVYAAPATN